MPKKGCFADDDDDEDMQENTCKCNVIQRWTFAAAVLLGSLHGGNLVKEFNN
jgi:hypothetical protein